MTTYRHTTVFLSPTQRQQLAQRAKETGAPIAELIRRAITEYFADRPGRRGARRKEAA